MYFVIIFFENIVYLLLRTIQSGKIMTGTVNLTDMSDRMSGEVLRTLANTGSRQMACGQMLIKII
jgi:hypothetical protein